MLLLHQQQLVHRHWAAAVEVAAGQADHAEVVMAVVAAVAY